MIIQGHPDILRGPQGLNGLHGFGNVSPSNRSPAYLRSMTENGGAGIPDLYQQIRDFINTHTDAEIEEARVASGVSFEDIANATAMPAERIVDCSPGYAWDGQMCRPTGLQDPTEINVVSKEQQISYEQFIAELDARARVAAAEAAAARVTPGQSPAYTRSLPENGGAGIPDFYLQISDFVAAHTNSEIQAAMAASGTSEIDVINALKVFPVKAFVEPEKSVFTPPVVTQPTQPMQPAAKDTGLTFPLIVSAIAAFFVLG